MISILYNLKNPIFSRYFYQNQLYVSHIGTRKTYRVLFFGSDNISLHSLKKINELKNADGIIKQLDLVTSNTTKVKNEIEKYAITEKVNIIQWPLKNLNTLKYDIGLIVAFGHLIRDDLLSKFPLGMVNVHPSLLPRWRGAAPIIHTLLNGDNKTGVTLMKIQANVFDVGEIISQKIVDVPNDILLPNLTAQLSDIGADMLVDCVRNLPESLKHVHPQGNVGVTYAKKVNKTISEVRWSEMSAVEVYNLYRAIYGLYPLSTKFRDKKMKLFKAFLHNMDVNQNNMLPGTIEYCTETNAIKVLCKDRRFIYFKTLRIVGKKEISALDFFNGYIKNTPLTKRHSIVCQC